MASRRRPSKSSSPLDERQRKLLEEEEILQKRAQELHRVIEEAPKIKAEKERAMREELLTDRSTRAHHRLNSTTIADNRFDQLPGPSPRRTRRRPLKAERRQTFLFSCVLVVILAFLVIWLVSVSHWQWPG